MKENVRLYLNALVVNRFYLHFLLTPLTTINTSFVAIVLGRVRNASLIIFINPHNSHSPYYVNKNNFSHSRKPITY